MPDAKPDTVTDRKPCPDDTCSYCDCHIHSEAELDAFIDSIALADHDSYVLPHVKPQPNPDDDPTADTRY